MSFILEREVVIVSNDRDVHREVDAVVARHPGARTSSGAQDERGGSGGAHDACIFVIDDAGREDALTLLHRLKAGPHDPPVVYLADYHSTDLEGAVRRAGASFYCVKAARDGQLAKVIDALLGQRER
jgi:DNA-binding NarL/FixJ family response regulator